MAAVDHGDGLGEPGLVALGLQRIGRARRGHALAEARRGGLGRRQQDVDQRGADQRHAGGDQRDADRRGDADGVRDKPAEINRGDHHGEHEDGAQRVLAAPAAALRQRHEHDQIVLANLSLVPAVAQDRRAVAQTDRRALEPVLSCPCSGFARPRLSDASPVEPFADRQRLGDGNYFSIPLRAERVVQHDDGAGHQMSPVKR